ncbi:MAG: glycosyltransferase family 4 protein, partial [Planctomycetota bacterium]
VTVHDVFALEEGAEGSEAWRAKMRRRYREVAERADLVLCVSAWTRERLLAHHPGLDPQRVLVVPPGVEARFRPEAASQAPAPLPPLALDGPYVLFLGALVARKRPGVLIEAWRLLGPDPPTLVLAGPDAGRGTLLRARAREAGVAECVRFVGHLASEAVAPLLAAAEALVLPSRFEGFGLPALEALACGTPVVHSGRGGLAEATGGVGVEVDPDEPASIAAGIRRVLEDTALRERLRARGLDHAAGHDWDTTARATRRAWARVAGIHVRDQSPMGGVEPGARKSAQ